jgi:hypothetical protein
VMGSERDDAVQAFATYGADQPFAMGVGRRHSNRGSRDADAPSLRRLNQAVRESLVSVMQEKPAITILGQGFS